MEWNTLVQRFGRQTIQSIWPEPTSLIVGTPDNGKFAWRDDLWSPLPDSAWYGTNQRYAMPVEPWIAIDWDNPHASVVIGRRITSHVNDLRTQAHSWQIPILVWPSKSGRANPVSQSQHVFLYLPALTPEEREQRVLQLLNTILDKPVVRGCSDPALAAEGLDPMGRFIYPAVGVRGITMGITAHADVGAFILAWRQLLNG